MAKPNTKKPTTKKAINSTKKTKTTIHKRNVKGTSELDNPKYAQKDFMLQLVESAAKKEDERASKKLERKARVAKIIEEKDAKKDLKAEQKKEKLEQIKQEYLQAKKKKRAEAKKQKMIVRSAAKREAELPPVAPKKKVRFA